ncbi:MAG: penicillin-insensitive murein endopeptidase [Myxococcales bacterium]|nr:penicillin-insensitive murein endopeptidase [Myxococcales bacterium]MCB9576115.1 penicillin-insensitive murein endopeptidase [Polyangiaceae bacterium]
MSRSLVVFLALGALLVASLPAQAGPERELPKRFQRSPFTLMSLSVGYPNHGWQVRAKKLRKRQYLHLKEGSHPYGHPALVLMLYRSAKEVARGAHGSVMLVGDLSDKDGGPLAGHRSHQSGRDADVAFYAVDKNGKPVTLDHFVHFDANGKATDGSGMEFDERRNWLLVQSWVRDKRAGLSHIFVYMPLRARLLRYAAKHHRYKKYVTEAAKLLKQPEDSSPHDDHFHVRISCPKRQDEICHAESR